MGLMRHLWYRVWSVPIPQWMKTVTALFAFLLFSVLGLLAPFLVAWANEIMTAKP